MSAPVLTPIDICESNPITFCLISWRNPIITDMDTIITITDKVIPMIAIRIPVDPLFRDDLSDKRCAKNNESDISPIESMGSLYFTLVPFLAHRSAQVLRGSKPCYIFELAGKMCHTGISGMVGNL